MGLLKHKIETTIKPSIISETGQLSVNVETLTSFCDHLFMFVNKLNDIQLIFTGLSVWLNKIAPYREGSYKQVSPIK